MKSTSYASSFDPPLAKSFQLRAQICCFKDLPVSRYKIPDVKLARLQLVSNENKPLIASILQKQSSRCLQTQVTVQPDQSAQTAPEVSLENSEVTKQRSSVLGRPESIKQPLSSNDFCQGTRTSSLQLESR